MKKLDHKILGKELAYAEIKKDIDDLIFQLDQKHYLHRKIKFLLDVRGYLKVNEIRGSYVEFGSFKSEMQYSAYKILNETNCVESYIGLDSFDGEVIVSEKDKQHNLYESSRDFFCDYTTVKKFLEAQVGSVADVIKGDFRKKSVQNKLREKINKISIAVLDCNFISSTEASLHLINELAIPGCVLFFDDYFTNFRNGNPAIPNLICSFFENKSEFSLIELGFYPPFGKSFILVRKNI